jgi:hypothetical protein
MLYETMALAKRNGIDIKCDVLIDCKNIKCENILTDYEV